MISLSNDDNEARVMKYECGQTSGRKLTADDTVLDVGLQQLLLL